MTPGADRRHASVLVLIGGVTVLVVIAYWTSYSSMLELWQQADHHHGLLVFPIAGYLLWRERASLAGAVLRPWAWGIPLLVALVGLWLLSRAIGVQAGEHLAAVLLIPAAVVTFLGRDLVRRALFPLLFVAMAVPIADSLVPALMRITADFSEALLKLAGVPVFREGQFMTLPGGQFEVADVCSGLRYLISGTIVALLFGHLAYRSVWKRLLLVIVTGAALIAANGVRAFVIMLVASATDMRYLAGRDHVYFGWLLFGLVIVALLWIGGRYADAKPATPEARSRGDRSERASLTLSILVLAILMLVVTARPFLAELGDLGLAVVLVAVVLLPPWILYRRTWRVSSSAAAAGGEDGGRAYLTPRSLAATFVAAVVLVLGPLRATELSVAEPPLHQALELPLPAGCDLQEDWQLDWRPTIVRPDFSAAVSYRCDDALVHAFVAGYRVNLQGRELVGEANRLIPNEWRRYTVRHTRRLDGSPPEVVELHVDRPEGSSLVWWWYSIGGRTALTPFGVKVVQAYEQIVRGRTQGSAYLLQTAVDGDIDASRRRLAAVAHVLAAAEHRLPGASTGVGDASFR